jgi:hypothetical protein
MNRRGFLKSILAAGIAPYVVTTAGVLMPIRQIVTAPLLFVYTASRSDPLAQRPMVMENGILIPAEQRHVDMGYTGLEDR